MNQTYNLEVCLLWDGSFINLASSFSEFEKISRIFDSICFSSSKRQANREMSTEQSMSTNLTTDISQ